MRQRRQIARRSDAAAARHRRDQVAFFKQQKPLERLHRHARVAEAEGVDLQLKHQAADLLRHQGPHPDGVAQQQVALQRFELVVGDPLLRQRAEAGVDAVIRLPIL